MVAFTVGAIRKGKLVWDGASTFFWFYNDKDLKTGFSMMRLRWISGFWESMKEISTLICHFQIGILGLVFLTHKGQRSKVKFFFHWLCRPWPPTCQKKFGPACYDMTLPDVGWPIALLGMHTGDYLETRSGLGHAFDVWNKYVDISWTTEYSSL